VTGNVWEDVVLNLVVETTTEPIDEGPTDDIAAGKDLELKKVDIGGLALGVDWHAVVIERKNRGQKKSRRMLVR